MANGYIEVTKREPCPICGTGDYCCHIPAEDGFGDVYICKRYLDGRVINPGGDTPSKIDGGFYLLLSTSMTGATEYTAKHLMLRLPGMPDLKYGRKALIARML